MKLLWQEVREIVTDSVYTHTFITGGGETIYQLKQDLLSLKKDKYFMMLSAKKKIKELKYEHNRLGSQLKILPMEKQGTTCMSWCLFKAFLQ